MRNKFKERRPLIVIMAILMMLCMTFLAVSCGQSGGSSAESPAVTPAEDGKEFGDKDFPEYETESPAALSLTSLRQRRDELIAGIKGGSIVKDGNDVTVDGYKSLFEKASNDTGAIAESRITYNPDPNDKRGLTDTGFIATAYYYNAAALTAKAAKIVGEEQESKKYERLAAEILAAINKKYVSRNGIIANDTQTAYALAIEFGLADIKSAGKRLNEKIAENGYKLSTGFIGTAFLLGALTKAGYAKTAYTLLLREELPSWLYAVNMGATTVWERWDSILPNGSIRAGEMNSLNHYAYGAVVSWVYKSIIGINMGVNGEGFTSVSFKPEVDERLKKVYGEYNSASGLYACGYEIETDEIRFELTVPYLGSAEFIPPINYIIAEIDGEMPNRKIALKGGKHTIICKKQTSKI